MNDMKTWYRSKTIWGALIAILASFAQFLGLEIGDAQQGEIVDAMMTLAGAVGGLVALYGRLAAQTTIGK